MTFTQSVKTCWHKYATFKGRASRPEFWWFFLAWFPPVTFLRFVVQEMPESSMLDTDIAFQLVIALAITCPVIAVAVRRLHDCGFSGWFLLMPVVGVLVLGGIGAMIGNIALTVMFIKKGYLKKNQHGKPPSRKQTKRGR